MLVYRFVGLLVSSNHNPSNLSNPNNRLTVYLNLINLYKPV